MALQSDSSRKLRRQKPRLRSFLGNHSLTRPVNLVKGCPEHLTRLPSWTGHAKRRAAQRNVSSQDVGIVLLYGITRHCAGAVIYFLRRKDIQYDDALRGRNERLVGATVVLDPTQQHVLTVYRNRNGFRHLKQKPVRDMRRTS